MKKRVKKVRKVKEVKLAKFRASKIKAYTVTSQKIRVSYRFDEDTKKKLVELSRKLDITETYIMESLIYNYYKKMKEGKVKVEKYSLGVD